MKRFVDLLGGKPSRIYMLLLGGVALVGLIRLLKDFLGLGRKHDFAAEYFDRLDNYINERGSDSETYAWLIKRSTRMQKQITSEPLLLSQNHDRENSRYKDSPVIIDSLPRIRSALDEGILSRGSEAVRYGSSVLQELLRHIGVIEDARREQAACLRNPFVWLREGVRFFMELPARLLAWLGIMSQETVRKVVRGAVVRAFAVFVTAMGLIGAIIVISVGWPHLRSFFDELIKWLHSVRLTRYL